MTQTITSRPAESTDLQLRLGSLELRSTQRDQPYAQRLNSLRLDRDTWQFLASKAQALQVTDEFRRIIDYFETPSPHTPAGFRVDIDLGSRGILIADLVRDISRDVDQAPRPTRVLYSADTANPYELVHVAPMVANLTCNPGIIYDLFINDPEANVGREFTTREQVMDRLAEILGPGCDISVELDNPFDPDLSRLLEEAARFREILSPWRTVIKVPHTGVVNADNAAELLRGDGHLRRRYTDVVTQDAFRGHNLAIALREHGFRVNFTLMFEPYQTQLALQARPYFINAFIRHRLIQSRKIQALLKAREDGTDSPKADDLRSYLIAQDYISVDDDKLPEKEVVAIARRIVAGRRIETTEGCDGLDSVRHSLRQLRQANLPDTRLIICSMQGELNYPDIDSLLASPEFEDMQDRVVVTAEPAYLARFTSTNQVISYHRRFLAAAATQNGVSR